MQGCDGQSDQIFMCKDHVIDIIPATQNKESIDQPLVQENLKNIEMSSTPLRPHEPEQNEAMVNRVLNRSGMHPPRPGWPVRAFWHSYPNAEGL
jgi:hypothetical protein